MLFFNLIPEEKQMKKILTVLSAVIFGTAVASAQVLSSQQMKNTA